jgi:NAD(P)-dependent dehydrogenase (short-subunit alcohol dehydrogenase family)
MTDHDELSGRTALITGGTRGIGKGIADRLRADGAQVLVAARSMPADASADQVVVADVATADGVAALAAEALERLGAIDIAVHNVGGSGQHDGGAATLTDEDWQSALETNLLAAVRLDRAVIPGMVDRNTGAIVHIRQSNGVPPCPRRFHTRRPRPHSPTTARPCQTSWRPEAFASTRYVPAT